MIDRAALLQAVLDEPDDDGVRLVAADWLEEHGEGERAEFIRVQVQLAGLNYVCLNEHPSGCRGCALRRRERELLSLTPIRGGMTNHVLWAGPASEGIWRGWEWKWARGFVEHVTLSAADCCAHLDAILAAQPVAEVTLSTRPTVEQAGSLGAFERRGIRFTLPPESTYASIRATSDHFSQVTGDTAARRLLADFGTPDAPDGGR